jgi:hypothetical protein
MIDSEESVDWFINKYVTPELSKPSYLKWKAQKQKLIDTGELPADIEEQLEMAQRKSQMIS